MSNRGNAVLEFVSTEGP